MMFLEAMPEERPQVVRDAGRIGQPVLLAMVGKEGQVGLHFFLVLGEIRALAEIGVVAVQLRRITQSRCAGFYAGLAASHGPTRARRVPRNPRRMRDRQRN